jgi:hypothetical protein
VAVDRQLGREVQPERGHTGVPEILGHAVAGRDTEAAHPVHECLADLLQADLRAGGEVGHVGRGGDHDRRVGRGRLDRAGDLAAQRDNTGGTGRLGTGDRDLAVGADFLLLLVGLIGAVVRGVLLLIRSILRLVLGSGEAIPQGVSASSQLGGGLNPARLLGLDGIQVVSQRLGLTELCLGRYLQRGDGLEGGLHVSGVCDKLVVSQLGELLVEIHDGLLGEIG